MVRLAPPSKLACGTCDLDAFVIELDDDSLDFRFELGAGLSILWALPAALGDRLRLIHVDGAAYWVDEPSVWEDPFVFDLPRTEWGGELGTLHDGSTVLAVSIAATATPASYRCEVVRRLATGEVEQRTFAWGRPEAPTS